MKVEVAWIEDGIEARVGVVLEPGACVADAIARSGLLDRIAAPGATLGFAVFGRRVDVDAPLADGDRVEITRPLRCAPGLARQRAAKRHRGLR